jgi:hypothetical protein
LGGCAVRLHVGPVVGIPLRIRAEHKNDDLPDIMPLFPKVIRALTVRRLYM